MNNDAAYLKKSYPHLYEVEALIDKIRNTSGRGNVFIDLRVVKGRIDKITTSYSEQTVMIEREDVFDD